MGNEHSPARPLKKPLLIFLLLVFAPIAASAARYFWIGDGRGNWQTADRSSAGLLPPASAHPEAMVRVFAARTVRWRSGSHLDCREGERGRNLQPLRLHGLGRSDSQQRLCRGWALVRRNAG